MSPKFYGYLWIVFAASAGVLWLGNLLTELTSVVFGFIAFGLIFSGMMCVLPGTVSHPAVKKPKIKSEELELGPATERVEVSASRVHFPQGLRSH